MTDTLTQLESAGLAALAAVNSPETLEAWRIEFIGSNGKLKAAFGALKDVPKEEKPAYGAKLNQVRVGLEEAFATKKTAIASVAAATNERIDMTEPGIVETVALGKSHVITRVRNELCEVFARLGFEVAEGPELEDDAHNFVKLNIPPGHPARDPIDNFYVDDPAKVTTPRMLRSQTSTVQIRTMEAAVARGGGKLQEPIKIISPGRVYRPDTVDATHSFMFHQIEGLYVDRNVSMVDLKTTLYQFFRAYFGPQLELRFSPTFYPFTEPSAQFEIKVQLREDLPVRWIELGGCGMVDPNVFKACGIDPEEWTGFAFGFGVERIAMGKYGIPDIRLLYGGDLRFLQQI